MKMILTAAAVCTLMAGSANAEKIGVAMSLFDDNFLTVLRHNIQRHADELGVEVQMEDAQGDITRQQSQIENFAASGVDGIITMLVDADSGRAMSKIAEEAGVPLVFVNMLPANMDEFPANQAWVGSDEEQAGRLETEAVCELLGGEGSAVILLGQLGTTGQRGRTKATEEVLASEACSGIEVLDQQTADWMRTPALDLMTNWITSGMQPDAVISNNDEMALGAIQALKSAGVSMDDVVVSGVDATQDALYAMEAGDLDVTVYQSAIGQGQGALETVLKIARGEAFEQRVAVPFELVTPENLAEYKAKN
ncbi:monosaccharide ABC transporter substrate-binding protein, CUT2 family (TC 3.A.1.2.-) [Paracoccus halophilus]|uniref:Monosaccharide ABC transporter substrate-binding protein, CUT2 family (TC 3.A.1.2.-) n=1 Tax=Paracoccus halophilus TaxID=376733 RepID=A0A099EY30_9RHOB|nr:sugar ABC transporter substrate-binding protein [Paracoccus halophilus]KGJ02842.1 rhizopine-binding protein [Paracoccus halophilus]SFA60212.1 monosaccharide ABC transporter substrate-binding protein, CUT2 family (TC 3.A.1.2.-) [Paracoccus halophilus]